MATKAIETAGSLDQATLDALREGIAAVLAEQSSSTAKRAGWSKLRGMKTIRTIAPAASTAPTYNRAAIGNSFIKETPARGGCSRVTAAGGHDQTRAHARRA